MTGVRIWAFSSRLCSPLVAFDCHIKPFLFGGQMERIPGCSVLHYEKELYPMQLKLYQIISANQQLDSQQGGEGSIGSYIVPESLKAASVMFTTIPILLIYPKLQKYFVDGVMTGAIKG